MNGGDVAGGASNTRQHSTASVDTAVRRLIKLIDHQRRVTSPAWVQLMTVMFPPDIGQCRVVIRRVCGLLVVWLVYGARESDGRRR